MTDDIFPAAIPAARPIVDASVMAAAAADQGAADRPAGDTAAIPAGRPAEAPAVTDWNAEANEFINFAHELYTPLWPTLEKVYTPTVRARIAARAAPVMQKYDFNMARLFGQYGNEIMLGAVLVPLVPPTLAAIRHDRLVREAQEKGVATNGQQTSAAAQPAATAPGAPIQQAQQAVTAPAVDGSPLNRFNDASAGKA